MKLTLCLCAVALTLTESVPAQGTFQDLNFESAKPIPLIGSPYYPYAVATSNAIPGWRSYLGVNETFEVLYDTVTIGGAAATLQSSTSSYPAIAGNYSVALLSSVGVQPTTAAVAQTGQIPATAASLQFYGASFMQVTFAGQLLPLVELGTGPSYQIMGADISAFAGQTGELKFLVPHTGPIGVMTSSYLDNIVFSSQQIPEPSAISLFGLAALFAGWRLRQRNTS